MEGHSYRTDWYIICNPMSGGGIKPNRIQLIKNLLNRNSLPYRFTCTQYAHHEKSLVQAAIERGYVNFICIGGDGTIHHMVNGIMSQNHTSTNHIKIAVIPTGTGNDWVRNYNIPRSPEKAVQVILDGTVIFQDIGKITLTDYNIDVYFNNAAGIGFDAFVVKNSILYKNWGTLAYLLSALKSFKSYMVSNISYSLDSCKSESELFLMSIGICRYSGGGMQLTNFKNHKSGLFDITTIKTIRLIRILSQIIKLYNGRIDQVKETHCSHAKHVLIDKNNSCFIQADGELVGKGKAEIKLITKAIGFIIP